MTGIYTSLDLILIVFKDILNIPKPFQKIAIKKLLPIIKDYISKIRKSKYLSYKSIVREHFDGYSNQQFKDDIKEFNGWSGIWMHPPDLYNF